MLPIGCSSRIRSLAGVSLSGKESIALGEQSHAPKTLANRLACTVLSKIKKFNEFADPKARESSQDREQESLIDYMWGRELIDLFLEVSSTRDRGSELCRPSRHASAPLFDRFEPAGSDEVHLTVAVVAARSRPGAKAFARPTWPAGGKHSLPPSSKISSCWPRHSDHHGRSGTGIAPFRAFVEERRATGAKGKNWLFFGDRSASTDYLYGEEWEACRKDGTVHELDLAWSRDQAEKVYVQHKMTERGSELWKWLQDGAVFYVCGDASRMAKDVDQALRDIASKEGGMGEDEAAAWVKALQKEKRYLKDVY